MAGLGGATPPSLKPGRSSVTTAGCGAGAVARARSAGYAGRGVAVGIHETERGKAIEPTTLGFKPATLRQWRRRRAIPAAAKSRLVYFFNDNFEILEAPPPIPANSTLASLAARYIRWSPNMTNQHSSRELPSQAAIAEKLDVSISSIKRARTIKATGATPVLEYEPAPAAAFAMLHLER